MQDSLLTTGSANISALSNSTTYYWRVRAKNIGGASAWTSARSFTTIIAQPGMPVLTLPADNAIDQPVSLPLSWTTVSTATAYHVQVSTVSDFSTIYMQDSLLTPGSTTVSGLSNSTKYYWRVRAKNIGGVSAWTIARSFTTIIAQPGMPVLTLPADNAIDQPVSLPLSWTTVSTTTAYHVQVSTVSDFSTIYMQDSLLTTGSTTVSGLTNSTKYYWRVRAKNVGGASAWTSPRNFTTIIAQPGMPVLTLSADNAIDQPVSLPLSWTTVSTATAYHVQVSTVSDFSTIYMEDSLLTTGSANISALSNSTKYYWRVRAKNIGGASAWTIARNFTTIIAQPGMPLLSLPNENAIDQPVSLSLSWNTVASATAYHVQVSTVSDFSTIYMQDSLLTTGSANISALSNSTTYYWRVRAKNIGGVSAWTSARSFTTIIAQPGMPVLSLPNDNAIDQPVSLSLSWNTVASATAYHVQVSTVNDFSTIYMQDSLLTAGSTTVRGLSNSTKYFWRVRAKNIGGVSAWTCAYCLTTVPVAPSAPILCEPSNEAINIPINLTLSWNRISSAVIYNMQVSYDSLFNSIIINDSMIQDTFKVAAETLTNDTRYFWRVNAANAGGNGKWSAVAAFTTIVTIPSAIMLKSPLSGDTVKCDSVNLIWFAGAAKVDSYQLRYALDSSFAQPMLDSVITDTFNLVHGLQNKSNLWWQVRGHNVAGWGVWSAKQTFSVKLPFTGVQKMMLPKEFSLNLTLGSGVIFYALPKAEHVHISIYDIRGRLCKVLVNSMQSAGYYSVNMTGRFAATGLYVVTFRAGEYRKNKRMVLIM